jgi:hypothetical protein
MASCYWIEHCPTVLAASCLAGGDLDGYVIERLYTSGSHYPPVIPTISIMPIQDFSLQSKQNQQNTKPGGRPQRCYVDGLCDFIVEYLNSDMIMARSHLGFVSSWISHIDVIHRVCWGTNASLPPINGMCNSGFICELTTSSSISRTACSIGGA